MKDIKEFFENKLTQNINQNYVKAFFKLIDEISYSGNHSGSIWNRSIDKQQNIKNLITLITQYEEKIK